MTVFFEHNLISHVLFLTSTSCNFMKQVSVLLLALSVAFQVSAQIYYQGGYSLGSVSASELSHTKSLSTYHIGVGNWFPLNAEKWAILGELNLSHKGYRQQFSGFDIDTRLTYLAILPAVSYELLPFLSLEGGVEVGYLFDVRVDRSGSSFGGKDLFKKMDVSPMVGLHFLDGRSLSFYLRYYHGLVPQLNSERIGTYGDVSKPSDLHNRLFQVGLRLTLFEDGQND